MRRLIVSYGRVKVLRLAVVALVLTTALLTLLHHRSRARQPSIYDYTEGRTSPWRDWKNKANATTSTTRSAEADFLDHLVKKHGLTAEVTWSARVVQAKYGGSGRQSMTEVAGKFMPKEFASVRVQDERLKLAVDRSALKLPVASGVRVDEVDASALLFGISTTYSRLTYLDNSLMRDWVRWLTDGNGKSNGASLLLTLQKSSDQEVIWVSDKLRSMGVDATVVPSDGAGESAYVDLVHKVKRHKEGNTRKSYVALVDDDIFFPSMGKLVQKLSKFDPAKEHYIGAPSERSDWVIEYDKTLTYGGGAVFLTGPMLAQLTQLPCLAEPAERREAGATPDSSPRQQKTTGGEQWDLLLYECITSHTAVDLHVLPSFYNPEEEQLYSDHDRRVLVAEGYASGAQPLTLHHYRNLHRFEAGKGHAVASACGEACFLQRFRFRDDWILVNGYTLSHYPDGVDTVTLKKGPKKHKFQDEDDQKVVFGRRIVVDGETGQKSDADGVKVVAWAGRKRTWRLLDARAGEGGEIWQAYVKRRGGGNSFGEIDERPKGDAVHAEEETTDKDSVVLLIWKP
ncbi:Glycosyltransferase family 31 protein [Coniochaeta hoffmannii]|uniref:Glycosyltransferase family 31 protein n=1 Tax=Coniochaeta hoffmannii TaxID=91930 RepID=A0AA38VSQ9_9PEZI|nr:Glycosyltransferase family 31 protein [Coniochaeta hoffmannii]